MENKMNKNIEQIKICCRLEGQCRVIEIVQKASIYTKISEFCSEKAVKI